MGWHVYGDVFEHSRQKGGKLLIMLAIAEKASNEDAVAFGIDQGWPKNERNARKRRETIAGKARLDPATVSRSIQELIRDDELEVRWVRQGQARWAVYRVVLGRYREREVDVEFLERHGQHLDRPFSSPAELRLPVEKRGVTTDETTDEVPDVLSGTSTGDYLTSDQAAPDEKSGGSPLYTRARVQQQVHEDQDLDLGLEEGEETAAAQTPASDAEISEVVRGLRGADAASFRTVLPLACDLPRGVFFDVVDTVRQRSASGTVTNPCGLLVSLLKVERAERVAAATAAFAEARNTQLRYAPAPWMADEIVRDAPDLYVRQLAQHLTDEELRARLEPHHAATIEGLVELASRVRAGTEPAADRETPEQARLRWVTDHVTDSDFPRDEIRAVIESWADVDDIERQELLERVQAHTGGDGTAQRSAAA